jgi:hypothetical protein
LQFEKAPFSVPTIKQIYGASFGDWTFSITENSEGWLASAKPADGRPLDGSTVWLGVHPDFRSARQACEGYIEKAMH